MNVKEYTYTLKTVQLNTLKNASTLHLHKNTANIKIRLMHQSNKFSGIIHDKL
ncbi:Orf146 [Heliothis zea nudivirus]|uniref:Orf146 n=1 Tax=Heliothis zea nudivirus 1 TaxID=3116536 RepID=Q8JKG7_9VIRU|nr:Orf146 [Heliothis zea nudivirus]AAN04438.1 Orf146 [Heliothis zea nudivirus]